jgi:hypothetical protein
MPHLVFKDTQRLRVLKRLLSQDKVMVYELIAPRPSGDGCAQYNARLKELREDGYHIVNVTPGEFRLEKNCLAKQLERLRLLYQLKKSPEVMAEGLMVRRTHDQLDAFYHQAFSILSNPEIINLTLTGE